MKLINREQRDFLIKNGYLKCVRGRYMGLVVVNKQSRSKKKTYYVEDRYHEIVMNANTK